MLFFLRKAIEALLLPIGFCGFLVFVAVLLRRRWIAAGAVGLLLVLSLPAVGILALWPLESSYPAIGVVDAPHADAIVMLSGSVIRGSAAPGVQWGNSGNRFFAAADLASAGKAKLLVISGGMYSPEGPILRSVAIRRGIQPERIVVTSRVSTTEDEARAVGTIAGIHSILLVTSAFHMPRAAMLFRATGLEVHPFPTDQRVPLRFIPGALEFVPDALALEDSEVALREYYGLLAYRTILFFGGATSENTYSVR